MSYICAYSTEEHVFSQKNIEYLFSNQEMCLHIEGTFEMADSKSTKIRVSAYIGHFAIEQ